jgi:glycosyltransferase involved in cell wall biosynthesis
MYSTKFTGIGKYTKQLIENLAKVDSHNQYLLYFNSEEFNNFKPPASNFTKYEVNAPHYSLKEQTLFAFVLYQTKPDIMHFTHFNSPFLYFRKQVTTIHDLTLHFYPGQKYTNPIQRFAYKSVFRAAITKSKKIITPTIHTANDLSRIYPGSKKKTITIHEGTDENFNNFTPDKVPNFSFELPQEYILYTGNWREHKNLNNLISAFEILKNQYDYTGKLIITGNPNSGDQKLQDRISKLVKAGSVITPGLIPEEQLPYLYYKASCYVFPSYYEGFGLPVLEAFATKTPVVVSNNSCLPEVGQNAVLTFNPEDPQEIAIKINQVLTNPETRSKLIEAGTNRLKDFSFEKMAKETLEIYNAC